LTSDIRKTQEAHAPYAQWLRQLREVCTACDIPLIFDEVYSGFRLAPGGAQEYFGVQADLVVYGKTVGGGMPVGVCCGRKELMCRFDPDHPMRLAYVIGTFSAHPPVMGAMNEFLRWVTNPQAEQLYNEANQGCTAWVASVNKEFAERGLPLRVVNLATVWTILFQQPGRYNWLLQYYLRAEGVMLSWVGTGRCLSNMAFTPEHYAELQAKLVAAASRMKQDGWWLEGLDQPERRRAMKSRLTWELIGSIVQVPKPLHTFYNEVMRRKLDDHVASHSHPLNQLFHLLSSSVFIYCYFLIFSDLTTAVSASLAALFVRQFGHALVEPPCHDKEELLLGFNTPNKTMIVSAYCLIPIANMFAAGSWTFAAFLDRWPAIAQQWWGLTLVVVLGRMVYLAWLHDFRISMIWFVKLVTDPFTDIKAYLPRTASAWRAFLPPYAASQMTHKH
jgi:glutamate-1-semialdehyde 2,1-aminomutase